MTDMPLTAPIPVSEYLTTSYRPDCDYLDGELLERNAGEREHSRLQGLLIHYLMAREKQWRIAVFPDRRIQVKANRFHVPDITVIAGDPPDVPIFTQPPLSASKSSRPATG
jgi:hypothetical protein